MVPSACFVTENGSEKRKKKQPITTTSNRHSDLHRASHSFKAARSRWKESKTRSGLGVNSCRHLWARHRLGRRESRQYAKKCKPHVVLPPFGESPKSITRHTLAIGIVLSITTAGVLLPIPSPPAAISDSSLGSFAVALGASEKSCERKFQ